MFHIDFLVQCSKLGWPGVADPVTPDYRRGLNFLNAQMCVGSLVVLQARLGRDPKDHWQAKYYFCYDLSELEAIIIPL